MSTTVKTGWLHDKNGDKFAPKTLTSQVQTSDGILIEDKIQTDLDTVKQEILDAIDLEGEASGFKKIGFTDDCDYVATSSNGIAAFQAAISEAADGDIILVMPGTYTSDSTLIIEKNISFIGVSSPIVNFPINVLGPVYDYENWTGWLSETEYDIHFENLTFNQQISVNIVSYDTVKSSHICAVNCIFNGINKIQLGYLGKAYNCTFNNSELSTAGYIGYSGGDMRFHDCKLNNITYTEYSYAEMNFNYYNCDITFANNSWEYPGGTFNNCNISATTEEYISI